MCCHPSITRKFIVMIDPLSKAIIRIPHTNLMRTSSKPSSGTRSTSDFLRDKSNLSSTNRARNLRFEFSKRSLSTPKTSPSPQNHSLRKKPHSTRSWLPTQLMLVNLLNSSNKKLKMSVGNRKSSCKMSALKSMRIRLLNLKGLQKSQGFFKGNLSENIFLDLTLSLALKKVQSRK